MLCLFIASNISSLVQITAWNEDYAYQFWSFNLKHNGLCILQDLLVMGVRLALMGREPKNGRRLMWIGVMKEKVVEGRVYINSEREEHGLSCSLHEVTIYVHCPVLLPHTSPYQLFSHTQYCHIICRLLLPFFVSAKMHNYYAFHWSAIKIYPAIIHGRNHTQSQFKLI